MGGRKGGEKEDRGEGGGETGGEGYKFKKGEGEKGGPQVSNGRLLFYSHKKNEGLTS